MKKSGFSVIIPIHNEHQILEKQVEKLIKFLKVQQRPFEIVLGENGSTDKKAIYKLGAKLHEKYPKTVEFVATDEKGVGNGIKIAILAAKYDHLIEMPIDLTSDLKFITNSVELLDKYDYVIGSKQLGKQDRHKWLEFLSKGYCFLTNLLLGINYSDYSVGSKAYRKEAVIGRLSSIDGGSFYQTEFIYFASKKKLKIIEIPVDCWDKRKSKFNFKKEVIYRSKNLVKLWFDNLLF